METDDTEKKIGHGLCPENKEEKSESTGFFPTRFYYAFRSMFYPVTRICIFLHISPNTITILSMVLAIVMGAFFALDRLFIGILFGLAVGFSDIVDGQLAKSYGKVTPFGGILDSTIDRYNEFFIFLGLSFRYYFFGRPLWIIACASAFLGSVTISYVKARAESDGVKCKIGRLQRPERLSLIGIGLLISGLGIEPGIDIVMLFLAVATHGTVLYRLRHVFRQIK